MCAEFAGVAAGMELLAGISRYATVPLAGIGVSALVLRGSFRRVEHVLLALSAVFVTYIVSGILAHPDWGAAAKGLVVPQLPLTRDAVLVAVATIGTTLAPWGLVFIQSYAADKHLQLKDLRFENVDVVVGAAPDRRDRLLRRRRLRGDLARAAGSTINDASDAAKALEPLAGSSASTLFGIGLRRRGPAGRGGRSALDRVLGRGDRRQARRRQRQLLRGAALLRELRQRSC